MSPLPGSARRRGTLVGQGDPSPIARPGRSPAVLAIHGFTSTPFAMRLVVDVATRVGLRAVAPLLPGHGTRAADLGATTFDDWARAVEDALDEASADGPAIVCGLSLGAVLATHLASVRPSRVRGLVALANALWLPRLSPGLPLAALEAFGMRDRDLYVPKSGADLTDRDAARVHLGYDAYPIRALFEVRLAGRVVRERLGRVACPTLAVHGARDSVVSPKNASRLAARVGTRDVEVVTLPRSAHVVTEDVDKGALAAKLEEFFTRLS